MSIVIIITANTGSSTAAIAGGVSGSILFIIILAGICCVCIAVVAFSKRQSRAHNRNANRQQNTHIEMDAQVDTSRSSGYTTVESQPNYKGTTFDPSTTVSHAPQLQTPMTQLQTLPPPSYSGIHSYPQVVYPYSPYPYVIQPAAGYTLPVATATWPTVSSTQPGYHHNVTTVPFVPSSSSGVNNPPTQSSCN